jgi:hypothetical protein
MSGKTKGSNYMAQSQMKQDQFDDFYNAQTSSPRSQTRSAQVGSQVPSESRKVGRWTMDEHFRFLEALQRFGKEWKRVQQHVGTRSST